MTFAARISTISERLALGSNDVWAVHDEACARQAAGEDILLLSVGDPDLATLPSTVDAAVDALRDGRTHYAPGRGELSLREAIAAIEIKASGKPCDPDEIVIFPGATNAVYAVLRCLLNAGDEIVVPQPMYVGYQGILDALGANVVPVDLDVDNGFALDVDKLVDSLSVRTRVLMLTTPGNPAGNMIAADQLNRLAAECLKRNIWLVCDEVYSMITFAEPHVSLRTAADKLDNVVVVEGLSKSHAMTGWRLGWTVSSLAFAEHLLNFTSTTIFGCCQFVQDAATHALKNDEEYISSVREEYRARRDFVCERIADIKGLSCTPPPAGMFVMVDVSAVAENGEAFARDLLAAEKVSVLPGAGFGVCTGKFVRLSLAQPIEVLEPALVRIAQYSKALNA
jgi:arginine:pyruvate transaminase